MVVVRRPNAHIRATRPHRRPRLRFPQVHSAEPGAVIPHTWKQPPESMDADDDRHMETAGREPDRLVGLDDNRVGLGRQADGIPAMLISP